MAKSRWRASNGRRPPTRWTSTPQVADALIKATTADRAEHRALGLQVVRKRVVLSHVRLRFSESGHASHQDESVHARIFQRTQSTRCHTAPPRHRYIPPLPRFGVTGAISGWPSRAKSMLNASPQIA